MKCDSLAEHLHHLLSSARLSASELARRLDMPSATIRKIRTGEHANPTISTLLPIANYFGMTISQLICESKPDATHSFASIHKMEDAIPLLTFEDALSWPSIMEIPAKISRFIAESQVGNPAFAVTIENNDYMLFPKGGVVIIDVDGPYGHGDYVLVHKLDQASPCLKRIVVDENKCYIQSIVYDLNTLTDLTPEYNILGVVALYKNIIREARND